MKNRSARLALATLAIAVTSAACSYKRDNPRTIYMPDMVYSPALKAQQAASMRMPVKGTVPRGFEPYHYTDVETAGRELKNPLRPTASVLKRGQAIYGTYCLVCHGHQGKGDGSIVPKFPRPPTLQSDKIRGYADGSIYHVISMGQNLMPSYASQISPGDRWAAIHYVRAIQRAQHPTAEDIKASEQ